MTKIRLKTRNFKISMFNIKISPKEANEDFTELYANLIKSLYKENLAVKTRGDKWMEMRTQFSYKDDKVLYGKLIYYTILDGTEWYNKIDKSIQTVDLGDALYPNAKEIEYFFIPEAHRFCFINKSNGVAMSQIEIFLKEALPKLVPEDKMVIIDKELSTDVIERIIDAKKVFRLEVGISYSNNDLSEDFQELFDNDLRESQIQNLNMTAKSFKSETIDLENSKILKAALKLSQSNGYAVAAIENDEGRNEKISTVEYPRNEPVSTTEGKEHIDIFTKIMNLFRNG